MRRLLFVDDEKLILDGLRSMLRPKRRQWEMTFLANGQEAIEELGRREFDVVVSDMRMPLVDGAAVLKHVQATQPNAVRIVLSGHTEMEVALRTMPVAHQFLSKPCDAATLESTIDRACNVQSLLADPSLRSVVGGIGRLPTVPALYNRLNEALENPNTPLEDVSALIQQDMAVSAKVLQVVNSGFFGFRKRETSIHSAVTLIGINLLRRVLLSVEALANFESSSIPGFSMQELQSHSHLTAMIASRLLKTKRESEDAFTAGILHDVGKLILATRPSVESRATARNSLAVADSAHSVDSEGGSVAHAEVGAYLLALWGLPYAVVEAVAYHHNPLPVQHETFDVVDAVYVGNLLAQEVASGLTCPPDRVDHAHLTRLGVENRLAEWRQMARQLGEAVANS